MAGLSPRSLSCRIKGLGRELGLQLAMGSGAWGLSGDSKGHRYRSQPESKCFFSIPFAQSLGQVVGAALLYPGEAGRLRAGPSPACGLTAPIFPAPGGCVEVCGPSLEPGRSSGTENPLGLLK